MSEIIRQSIKENKGKVVTLWLKNNFKFSGVLDDSDDEFIKLYDLKTKTVKIFNLSQISQIDEVRND